MRDSMFERLQSLPLLLGLGVHDLMNIVEKVKFGFDKYYDGDIIVYQGDRCGCFSEDSHLSQGC